MQSVGHFSLPGSISEIRELLIEQILPKFRTYIINIKVEIDIKVVFNQGQNSLSSSGDYTTPLEKLPGYWICSTL